MTWRQLHPAERTALAIFLALFASTFIEAWLYRRFWILGFGALGILSLAAIVAGVVYTGVAAQDAGLNPKLKLRAVASIPIAIGLVLISKFGLGLGSRVEASAYLLFHRQEMRHAEEKAAPGQPASITFLKGIPDGGEAIIRWSREPTQLTQVDQVKLTGERIKRCRRIVSNAWLCGYD